MLTNDDLTKIENIVEDIVESKVEKIVRKSSLSLEKKLTSKMIRGQNLIIRYFDESYLDLRSRVERIEEKLGLASTN